MGGCRRGRIRPSFNEVQDERMGAGGVELEASSDEFRMTDGGIAFPFILNSVEGWAEKQSPC